MNNPPNPKRYPLVMPRALWEAIEKAAQEDGENVASVIRTALREYLKGRRFDKLAAGEKVSIPVTLSYKGKVEPPFVNLEDTLED